MHSTKRDQRVPFEFFKGKVDTLRFSGALGVLTYWIFVIWAASRNPWFSIYKYALSSLGDPRADYFYVYNFGLIVSAFFFFVFSIYLILKSKNKVQIVGGAYVSISSLFMALIGIFYDVTKPHSFIATYFFVQFFLGMAVFGLGTKNFTMRYIFPSIFFVALISAYTIPFKSMALLETYEISLILFQTLVVALKYKSLN